MDSWTMNLMGRGQASWSATGTSSVTWFGKSRDPSLGRSFAPKALMLLREVLTEPPNKRRTDSRDPGVAKEGSIVGRPARPPWSEGVLEYWGDGVMEDWNKKNIVVADPWSNYYKRLRSGRVCRAILPAARGPPLRFLRLPRPALNLPLMSATPMMLQ